MTDCIKQRLQELGANIDWLVLRDTEKKTGPGTAISIKYWYQKFLDSLKEEKERKEELENGPAMYRG